MNPEKGSWGKVVGTIKDRLGLGPSRTEILEREEIPEIFALAGQTGDLTSISTTSQLAIPLPTDERGGEPKELKVASFTSLDLTNVLPNLERADGEEVTLADVLLALRNSAGKDKMQVARRNVPKIKERFHGQDRYVFTLNINGKPKNISYITRKGFIKGAGALSVGAILAACAGALFPRGSTPPQPTLPPPGASIVLKPTPQEEAPSPDLPLRLVNVADAVPAFKNARDNVSVGQTLNVISFGADTTQTPNPMDGQDTTYLQVTKHTDTSYLFDRVHTDPNDQTPISPISIDIQPNSVNVGLPFGSSEKLVETNGMVQIPDMNDPKTYDFIRNAVGLPPASKLFFAGGNEGAELRGHAILFGETEDANPTEVKSWVVMPWLTQKGVIATIGNKNGVPTVFFSGEGTGGVELSKLLVKMDKKSTVVVSPDGKYNINYGNGGFEPLAKFLRVNGVPENIISYYENLFIPPVLNEAWASNKETLQVQPENIFPILGGINHANRYALDMAMGTMKLVVKQSLDLTLTANHNGIRGTLGLVLDNNAEFKVQAMKVRANIASTDDFKGSKDYSDLTLVIEAGVVTMAVLKVKDELRKYKVDAEGNITQPKKEEEPLLLPELTVDGPYIKRADTGEIVEFKGVNVPELGYASNADFSTLMQMGLQEIVTQDWNMNLLRVGINPDNMNFQLLALDTVVNFAAQHGMYVILNPNREGNGQPSLPSDKVKVMMGQLSARYRNKNNVMYGLFNEPDPEAIYSDRGQAIAHWREVAQPIADIIRQNNPDAIVVVPGHTKFAGALDDYLIHPFQINGSTSNIIYDAHLYLVLGGVDYNSPFRWSIEAFIKTQKAPVLIGEFGGTADAGSPFMQKPEDIEYMETVLKLVNDNPGRVLVTAWGLPWDDTGMFKNPHAKIKVRSARGDLIYADTHGSSPDSSQNRPYDFLH